MKFPQLHLLICSNEVQPLLSEGFESLIPCKGRVASVLIPKSLSSLSSGLWAEHFSGYK